MIPFLSRPRQMLIAGRWVDALSGERIDSIDPATGRVLTSIPAGGPEDIDLAVNAASTEVGREVVRAATGNLTLPRG
jgi:phenylacetaldehyde dehydrogenase